MTKKRWDIPKHSPAKPASEEQSQDGGQLAGLAGLLPRIALFVNALLAGAGYMFLAGYLARLGISISELELGLPSLLFYGYSFTLDALISGPKIWLFGATMVLMFVVMLLAQPVLVRAYPGMTSNGRLFWNTLGSAVITLALLLLPSLVFNKGVAKADRADLSKMELSEPSTSSKSHQITSPDGSVSGVLVIADQRYTYLRSGNVVYKIANDSQKVVRAITFTSEEIEKPEEQDGQ